MSYLRNILRDDAQELVFIYSFLKRYGKRLLSVIVVLGSAEYTVVNYINYNNCILMKNMHNLEISVKDAEIDKQNRTIEQLNSDIVNLQKEIEIKNYTIETLLKEVSIKKEMISNSPEEQNTNKKI